MQSAEDAGDAAPASHSASPANGGRVSLSRRAGGREPPVYSSRKTVIGVSVAIGSEPNAKSIGRPNRITFIAQFESKT